MGSSTTNDQREEEGMERVEWYVERAETVEVWLVGGEHRVVRGRVKVARLEWDATFTLEIGEVQG